MKQSITLIILSDLLFSSPEGENCKGEWKESKFWNGTCSDHFGNITLKKVTGVRQ